MSREVGPAVRAKLGFLACPEYVVSDWSRWLLDVSICDPEC